jgi:hypothetical protein
MSITCEYHAAWDVDQMTALGRYLPSTISKHEVCLLPLDTPKQPFRIRPTQAIGGTSASLASEAEADQRLSTRHSHSLAI